MFKPLARYADFQGRSRRSEFWLWTLFNIIIYGALGAWLMIGMASSIVGQTCSLTERAAAGEFDAYIASGGDTATATCNGAVYQVPSAEVANAVGNIFVTGGIPFIIMGIWALLTFIPSLAVAIRRLHDQDKSGWLYLVNFIPFVGGLIFLVFMFLDGTPGPNQYGPDPKGR